MARLQLLILWAGNLLLLLILAGLVIRRRLFRSPLFAPYLLSVLVPSLLTAVWPERFYVWTFWLAKETLQTVLKLGLALDLAYRLLRRLPQAHTLAQAGAALGLVLTGAAAFFAPIQSNDVRGVALAVLPRVLYGTALLFAALLGLVAWFRIPLDRLNKAILVGFVPYLLTVTLALNLLTHLGFDSRVAAGYLSSAAYTVLLCYWTWAAWLEDDPLDPEEQEAAKSLHPWR
jgi:hypothetical protein